MTMKQLPTIAALLKVEFEELYLAWGSSQPPRTGLHASSLLVSDQEWCVRRHVLADLFPGEASKEELKPWDVKKFNTFLHGWEVHRKFQLLFREHFHDVVYSHLLNGQLDPLAPASAELDLTHYDPERNLYFSPDAILEWGGEQYIVEIKGIKQESFESLTDRLEIAMERCETVYKAVMQCNLYMHLTDVKRGIILIENKNTQVMKVWCIEYDFALFKPYRDRIYDVKGTLALTKAGKPSVKMARVCASINEPRARKCPMRDVCFREKE